MAPDPEAPQCIGAPLFPPTEQHLAFGRVVSSYENWVIWDDWIEAGGYIARAKLALSNKNRGFA
jgi:hypothetical protein